MTTIERSIFIEATPEAVTAVSDDASRFPEWFTAVEKVETDGNWPTVGSIAHLHMKSPGLVFKVTFTSTEHVAGEKSIAKMEGVSNGTNAWHYKAEDGGTAVSYKLEYSLSDDAEGQAMDKLVAERANEISIEQSLKNLKALVEGK
jgi:carbon monoxide dehydrogenase subunit G